MLNRLRIMAWMLLTPICVMLVHGPAVVMAQASPVASPAATPASGGLESFLATPAGAQVVWILAQLNGTGEPLTAEVYAEHFDDSFIDVVPFDQFAAIVEQLAASGPYTPISVSPDATETSGTVLIQGSGVALNAQIAVLDTEPHRILGLLFQAVASNGWADVDAALGQGSPDVDLLAAEVTDSGCETVHAANADKVLAIGSIFKLYILGELARQIEAGQLSWDDEIPVQDEYKSLPSGDLRNEPDGTLHTIRYFAELMISQSDNTATDHLLFYLGRENVEAMLSTMGNSNAARNLPLLSTREMFAIKLRLTPERQRAYVEASVDERRAMLDGEIKQAADELTLADTAKFTSPILIDSVEWYASPSDLCNAMAYLEKQFSAPGLLPVREILTLNPGIGFDRTVWPVVAFKGGSEPGVIAGTWLLQRSDGRWFVISVGQNDPNALVDDNAVLSLAGLASTVLGQAP